MLVHGSVDNLAHDLMSGNDRLSNRRQFPFDDVQIGAADSTGANAQEHLSRRRFGFGNLPNFERTSESVSRRSENGCFHQYFEVISLGRSGRKV